MNGKKAALLAVLLLAAWLRFDAAARDIRFHPDEALYATFARDAVTYGDWWLSGPLDKPPLSLYASALALHATAATVTPQNVIDVALKQGEFAVRLPNVFAGIVLVALGYAVTRHLYGKRVALLASFLLAISPHAVGYSASGFTDMLMLAFALAAVLVTLHGKPISGGLLIALSIATKPQGVFYAVLVVALMAQGRRGVWRDVAQCGAALLAGLVLLLLWDILRPGESFLSAGNRHINPGRPFSTPAEWPNRLHLWLDYGAEMLGPAWLTAAFLVAGLIGMWANQRMWFIAGFALAYSILHIGSALPLFDRYLLLVLPPLVIVVAYGLNRITEGLHLPRVGLYAMILLLAWPAIPYDTGQHGRRDGDIIALAAYVNSQEMGAIIYDHWLGWETGYYLGAWSDKRRVYYPTPETFREDAPRNPDRAPRYLIAPENVNYIAWLDAARAAGFNVTRTFSTPGFVVYTLTTPTAGASTAGSS